MMALFQWLGKLLDDLIDWLGRAFKEFLENLIWALQRMWDTIVAGALFTAFGAATVLYVIFYAGAALGETVMEIWDPKFYDSKPSEIFEIDEAPQDTPLPTQRSKAKVLKMKNMRY